MLIVPVFSFKNEILSLFLLPICYWMQESGRKIHLSLTVPCVVHSTYICTFYVQDVYILHSTHAEAQVPNICGQIPHETFSLGSTLIFSPEWLVEVCMYLSRIVVHRAVVATEQNVSLLLPISCICRVFLAKTIKSKWTSWRNEWTKCLFANFHSCPSLGSSSFCNLFPVLSQMVCLFLPNPYCCIFR